MLKPKLSTVAKNYRTQMPVFTNFKFVFDVFVVVAAAAAAAAGTVIARAQGKPV